MRSMIQERREPKLEIREENPQDVMKPAERATSNIGTFEQRASGVKILKERRRK